MNSKEVFSLGLESPCQVSEVCLEKADDGDHELHLYSDSVRCHKFESGVGKHTTAHDTFGGSIINDNPHRLSILLTTAHDTFGGSWKHLFYFQNRCYLHAGVPWLPDSEGKAYQREVPLSRPGVGFTWLSEAFSNVLTARGMPVFNVVKTPKATSPRIWSVVGYRIKRVFSKDASGEVRPVGLDGTSAWKKGHEHIAQFVDLEQKRTIFFTEGKDSATNLSTKRKYEPDTLLPLYPKLVKAYHLRQMFSDVFDVSNAAEAEGYFGFWRDQAKGASVEPFRKFVNMLKPNGSGIVACFDNKFTDRSIEVINSKIQIVKRRTRGYRETKNHFYMLYFSLSPSPFSVQNLILMNSQNVVKPFTVTFTVTFIVTFIVTFKNRNLWI